MSARLDVAGRMAEGRQAVEHMKIYLQACQMLGCPPLDVGDAYQAEAGLDLQVLDADCAALRAAVNMVEEAMRTQRTQVTELASGWRGAGADAATRFLQRHCDTAEQVSERVRSAAESCATLRDNLWQSVDTKVATTIAVDDRRAAQRPTWLAAAHTVATGAADRSVAEEVLRRQVIPFVDNDIRRDWLTAMHSAAAMIAGSYDTAIHALTSAPDASFEIPGELDPSWQPVSDEPVRDIPEFPASSFSTPAEAAPTVAAPAPAPAPAPAQAPGPPPPATDDMPAAEDDAPLGDMAGLSSGAGGLGAVSGGIGGVIASIVDGIGSLIGSLTGGLGGASGDQVLDDPLGDADDPAEDADHPAEDTTDPVLADEPVVGSGEPADTVPQSPPAADAVADPPAAAPPDPPPPAANPLANASTPCEIAEDQLPQAGQ